MISAAAGVVGQVKAKEKAGTCGRPWSSANDS
jgi:hypothetical protein